MYCLTVDNNNSNIAPRSLGLTGISAKFKFQIIRYFLIFQPPSIKFLRINLPNIFLHSISI